MYGISDFNQNSRLSGIKYHEKYQNAFGSDQMTFKRQNGEFTELADRLSKNRVWETLIQYYIFNMRGVLGFWGPQNPKTPTLKKLKYYFI